MQNFNRRSMLKAVAAGSVLLAAPAIIRPSRAWAEGDALERIRKAGVLRLSVANALPWSGVNMAGDVIGVLPAITKRVMNALGIEKIEPLIGTYAQAIPGLLAGRWDMVGGLNPTAERCSQVAFSAPMAFDGLSVAYVPNNLPNAPKSLAELATQKVSIGVSSGSWAIGQLEKAGVAADQIVQLPDSTALVEALIVGRIQTVVYSNAGLAVLRRGPRENAFAINYPLTDAVVAPANAAFLPADVTLREAFDAELLKLKQSGEFSRISEEHGFQVLPGQLEMTAAQACAA